MPETPPLAATRRAGNVIRAARRRRNMTQQEAAAAAGVSVTWFRAVEQGRISQHGRTVPAVSTPETYAKIADAVDADVKEVLTALVQGSGGNTMTTATVLSDATDSDTTDPLVTLVRNRINEQGLSYRVIEERAEGLVSRSYLSKLLHGRHALVTEDRYLRGLALGLDLPVAVLQRAARESTELRKARNMRFALPARAGQLSDAGWRALLAHVDYLLDLQGRQGES